MRILSWNINGIRTLPQYHPWNTLKTGDAILDELGADIVCFQEMKITRSSLPRTLALPSTYDSFFSFPTNKVGYSGVGVYTHSQRARPLKAEEGLTGSIHPTALKPPWNAEQERISSAYPRAYDLDLFPDEEGNTPNNLNILDDEGRALTLDFGLFVLINTYCPNETSDARLPYKMNYHLLLQSRVDQLIKEGREVIVLGDLNICAQPLDHADGHLESVREKFWEHPARKWSKAWFGEEGVLVDVVRRFWPDRKAMYTCWNTRISARESNYGARVDYILVTPGLLPWIKAGNIQPELKGSDHCPIWVDLWEEIEVEVDGVHAVGEGDGKTKKIIRLRDVMRMSDVGGKGGREPPRLAAKYWEEYSGKQTLLSTFFGKGGGSKDVGLISPLLASSSSKEEPTMEGDGDVRVGSGQAMAGLDLSVVDGSDAPAPSAPLPTPPPAEPFQPPSASQATLSSSSSSPPPVASPSPVSNPQPILARTAPTPSLSQYPHEGKKRKQADEPPGKSKKKKQKPGQTKLSTFFAQPSSSSASASGSTHGIKKHQDQDQLDSDYRLALELSASQEALLSQAHPVSCSSSSTTNPKANGKQITATWSHLLAPIQPPKCLIHNEPAKELTVTKPGPNKGKNFFICSRPVGPGYDRGKAERLREEVDHQYRCNFFKWSSEVKREAMKEKPMPGMGAENTKSV